MTSQQYRDALAVLGLTQVGAARLLGVNEATSRRWAAHGVTGTAAILLRLLVLEKVSIQDVKECNGEHSLWEIQIGVVER